MSDDDGLFFARVALRGRVVTDVRPWDDGPGKNAVAIFVDDEEKPAVVFSGVTA